MLVMFLDGSMFSTAATAGSSGNSGATGESGSESGEGVKDAHLLTVVMSVVLSAVVLLGLFVCCRKRNTSDE